MQPCSELPAASAPAPADFPPGAKRLPALPAEVEIFDVPPPSEPLTWTDCGSGCLELETPWEEPGYAPLYITSNGGLVGGEPWLILRQRLVDGFMRTWMGPAPGTAVHALMERRVTGTVNTGFSDHKGPSAGVLTFTVHYRDQILHVFGLQPGSTPVCVGKRTPSYAPRAAAISTERWAITGGFSPVVTGAWPVVAGEEDIRTLVVPTGDELGYVGAAAERLFWRGYGGDKKQRLWTWRPGADVEFLVEPAADGSEDHCCAAADDQHIAYQRGTDRYDDNGVTRWARIELWVHSVPVGLLPLAGTMLRTIPQDIMTGAGVVSQGYWAAYGRDSLGSDQYVYVVRLSDGQLWKIQKRSPEVYWTNILYLSSTEIALLEKVFGTHTPWAHTVVRYQLDSLGPGEPPRPPDAG